MRPFALRVLPNTSEFAPLVVAASLLAPTLRDPFISDPISAHSPTRGECSLFLQTGSAFSRERLLLFFYQ